MAPVSDGPSARMAAVDETAGVGGDAVVGDVGGHRDDSAAARAGQTAGQTKVTVPFQLETRRTFWYLVARLIFTTIVGAWFRPVVSGRTRVPLKGAAILAPVHRSFADFAFLAFVTRRKLFFMTKDDLWTSRPLGKLLLALGAFPVNREAADREALRRAQEVLELGQLLVLFPEGTRHDGPTLGPLHEGAAFLAARTGTPIVPIGIGARTSRCRKAT